MSGGRLVSLMITGPRLRGSRTGEATGLPCDGAAPGRLSSLGAFLGTCAGLGTAVLSAGWAGLGADAGLVAAAGLDATAGLGAASGLGAAGLGEAAAIGAWDGAGLGAGAGFWAGGAFAAGSGVAAGWAGMTALGVGLTKTTFFLMTIFFLLRLWSGRGSTIKGLACLINFAFGASSLIN